MNIKKKYSTSGASFIDEAGRQVTLHGINMVCKDKDRNYIGDYKDEDFRMLQYWGINVIRLGIFWDGIEPEPGRYDDDYLNKIDKLIGMAEKHNIAVFLDMHQDLFSCLYADGAPEWATLTGGEQHIATELWSEAYFLSPAVMSSFDSFWSDSKAVDGVGVMEHFINMWRHIAERYAANKNVIGYDFFNEPFPGSTANRVMMELMSVLSDRLGAEIYATKEELMEMWLDPEKKLELLKRFDSKEEYKAIIKAIETAPQEFDINILSSFYQKLADVVRIADETSMLIFEANYFCNTGIECAIRPVRIADGQQDRHQVFSPHGYDLLVDTSMYDCSSYERLRVIFEAHKRVGDKLGIPILIGEWGCFPEAGSAELSQAEFLYGLFSKYGVSEVYYDFSHIKNNRITEAVIHPYIALIAGQLHWSEYNPKTYLYACEYTELGGDADSKIYVPDVESICELSITPVNSVFHIERIDCDKAIDYNEEASYGIGQCMNSAGYLVIESIGANKLRRVSFCCNR